MTTATTTKPQLTEDQKGFVAQILTRHSGKCYEASQIKGIYTMNDEYQPDVEGRWLRVALVDGSCYYLFRETARKLADQIREATKVEVIEQPKLEVVPASVPNFQGLVQELLYQKLKTDEMLAELKVQAQELLEAHTAA